VLSPGGISSIRPGADIARVANNDLAVHVLELREALRLANSDKKALQDWAEVLPKKTFQITSK
jgi:hypothetical protein